LARFSINPPVFFGAVGVIGIFLGIGALLPGRAEAFFLALQASILAGFGWLYLLAVGIFLVAMLILALGQSGDLKLGPDDSEPDFPFMSWIAMLFAAGMGIGLMYFAVAEPVTHFVSPPEAMPRSIAAQREAMRVTFFHWGIHAWAIYAVVGLSLAYFGHRYKLPLTIRSGLYPLLGRRIEGMAGHVVDVLAICGTVFGIATSLGFGVLQISAGLEVLIGLPATTMTEVLLIVAIMGVATLSVLTGLDKGVRRLSELNLVLAIALMLFVFVTGPTRQLLRDFVQNIGLYLDSFVLRTFNIYAYEPRPWIDAWTLFYWAWWISWSPFVGMFIARISRGRTVRQFVVAVLFIPAGFTFFWMTVFGNTAIHIDLTVADGALARAVGGNISTALFDFFGYLPLPAVTSTLAVGLVAVFFVTSADSGSLVVDSIAAGGRTDTGALQRVFWCALEGVVAAVLLMTGGLAALQAATIATALPFTIVLLILVWGLWQGMQADLVQRRSRTAPAPAHPAAEVPWQRRLSLALRMPTEAEIADFIARTVEPALTVVADELRKRGRPAVVTRNAETGAVALTAPAEGVRDFVYGVQPSEHKLPAFFAFEAAQPELRYKARTFFSDGSRGYDVMGLTRDQMIADVLAQFEQYLALVQTPEAALVARAPGHA